MGKTIASRCLPMAGPPIVRGYLAFAATLVAITLVAGCSKERPAPKENPAATKALFAAAEKGDLTGIATHLKDGADLEALDRHGISPLMTAVHYDRTDAVRALLDRGAKVNARDKDGRTALMYGFDQSPTTAALLLDRGADANAVDKIGRTPLMWATTALRTKVVALLLSRGAKVDAREKEGATALHFVGAWTQYDVVAGQEQFAAETAAALLKAGADVNAAMHEGTTPLMTACGQNHGGVIEELLKAKPDLALRDGKGRTALTWAARYGRSSIIVKWLLSRGAKIELIDAMLMKDSAMVRRLLDEGAPPLQYAPAGETTLVLAAEQDDLGLVSRLIKVGVPINAKDSQGMTALMVATGGRFSWGQMGKTWGKGAKRPGRRPVLRALLAAGADPLAKNEEGDTAITIAKEIGAMAELDLLNTKSTIKSKPGLVWER